MYLTCKFQTIPYAVPSPAALKAIRDGSAAAGSNSTAKPKASRVRVGLASVYGNEDRVNDIVAPEAFDDPIKAFTRGIRPKLMLNHENHGLPIGRLLSMRSITANELPASIREQGGTGALLVEKYYFESQRAQDTLEAVDAGEMAMSFGFNVLDSRYEDVKGSRVRVLTRLDLQEVSDVCYPANPLATAVISKSYPPGKHEGNIERQRTQLKLATLKSSVDLMRFEQEMELRRRYPSGKSINTAPRSLSDAREFISRARLDVAKLKIAALKT